MSYPDMTTLIVTVIVLITAYIAFNKRNRKYKLPPGPKRLPIIGTMHKASIFLVQNVVKIRQNYGDVSLFYAGSIPMVFLNSIEMIKEALINKAKIFSDRGHCESLCIRAINPHLKGLIFSDYSSTLRHNKIISSTILKNLGAGKSTMEERILEEVEALVCVIESKDGAAFDPWHTLSCSMANVILSVMFSKRYTHDDPELLQIVQWFDDEITTGSHTIAIDTLNFLRYVPPFNESYTKIVTADAALTSYAWKHVQEHLSNFHGQTTDFVYNWLHKSYNHETNKSEFDEEDFKIILRDCLIAGTDTMATSLKWTLVQLANHPDIQTRLHDEMDRYIGTDQSISLSDSERSPYLDAFIWEVQRRNIMTPFALPHYTKIEAKIGDYDIPAKSVVCLNIAGVHLDENTFKDPYTFRPDRFINCEGQFEKHPNVIPFGVGKRSCLGELLARQELFLFTAALVQRFTFLPPEGSTRIDDEGVQNFTYVPKRFTVRALPR